MSFVDEGPTIRDLYNTNEEGKRPIDSRSPSSSSTTSRNRPISSAPFESLLERVSSESSTNPTPNDSAQSQDLERYALVSILPPTAYQSQLLALFLGTLVSRNSLQTAPAFDCHSTWLTQLASRTEVSATLLYAIRAISLSFLGRQVQDENLVYNSRLIYGKTLLRLNKALQDPNEGLASDTLCATVLLTFYELLNCTEYNSWVRHAGGAAHLMRLRGVARHRTEFDKAIFGACRYSMLMESYQTGKPCFLSLAPWRKLSQEIHESSPRRSAFGDAKEAFFQEIVHHPEYVMDSVNYVARGGRDRSTLQDLVHRGHIHRSNHKAIHRRCVEALRDAGQEPTEVPSSSDDEVFPTVYQYPGIHVAAFFCSYWTLLKVLNMALIGLEARLSAMESGQSLQEQMTPAQTLAARNIKFNPENVARAVVADSAPSRGMESDDGLMGSGETLNILPYHSWSSTATDVGVVTQSSGSPTPSAASPIDYFSMSPCDTAKRRQMYMAECRHSARQICKSVENIGPATFLGPLFLIFSLKAITRMLNNSMEKGWVLRKMEILGKTWTLARVEAERTREEHERLRMCGSAFGGS